MAALAIALFGCGGKASAPPNLLLITVDTLRADRLACYGGPPDLGRAICALAEGGTRFAWAFATAPSTTPSVASLLTSLYPAFHGVSQGVHVYLSDSAVSVAELLQGAGYATAAIVSNPVLESGRNFTQGFDFYDEPARWKEREARATTDAALAWARQNARSPWFLWVHYQDPHGPYAPPDAPPVRDLPGEPRLRVLRDDYHRNGIPLYQALPGLFTQQAYESLYLAEIRHLDTHVSRLVRGIDDLGRPPAILLTADHGEAFGEDGYYFAHGHSVGLDQVRVPLLWRPAGTPPASGGGSDNAVASEHASRSPGVVKIPVSLIDVAPTLLSLAGLAPSDTFQGRPLPVAGADPVASKRQLFIEHRWRVAIVEGDTLYERDRRPEEGAFESGATPRRLPERVATLEGTGPLPGYALPSPDHGALFRGLDAYLATTRNLPAAPRHEEVSNELRDRLRELGYTE